MKKRLVELLACPLDRGPLELRIWESKPVEPSAEELEALRECGIDAASVNEEIITGVLLNPRRKIAYPIYAGVPRLLVFRTGIADQFAGQHAKRLQVEMPDYKLPDGASMPGEADVLRTFSSEWLNYDWDGKTYWNLTTDSWLQAMRFVLGLDEQPLRGKLVLEVGMGIGGVCEFVARSQQCEVVGMDLGYSVDVAQKHFGDRRLLHVVQASIFAPPFPVEKFDFVYSWGVIHHTFDTRTAFQRIADLPKPTGRLYIWVYSPYNEERTLARRTIMRMERLIRPVVTSLPEKAQAVALTPLVPLYIGYQWVRAARRGKNYVRYGWREAMHAARDRFTPSYIHRHTEQEVVGWFQSQGYGNLICGSQRVRPEFVPLEFITNTGVWGTKSSTGGSVA